MTPGSSVHACDEQAVAELAEQGDLPGRKLAGEWRFARETVLDWLAKR